MSSLSGFDPKLAYPAYKGMTPITSHFQRREKEALSLLLIDMIDLCATHSELSRVVRHSMVVMDAEKHNLDYTQSAIDNCIDQLKIKYQRSS